MAPQPQIRKWRSALALRAMAVVLLCVTVSVPVLNFVAPVLTSNNVATHTGLSTMESQTASTLQLTPKQTRQTQPLTLRGAVGGKDQPLTSPEAGGGDMPKEEKSGGGMDIGLFVLIILWYVGNYYHNITNKIALNAGAGYPMLISTGYLAAGSLYALFMWAAPDGRPWPQITMGDYMRTLPVSFAAAGAHMASCFALSAGSLSFVQIVKAMEPAFAAVIGSMFYGAQVTSARWLSLIPIIGGVAYASTGELSFAWSSLFIASVANAFAAVKGGSTKVLMDSDGLKDRMGSIGNQFAIMTINSFIFCLILSLICEGHKLGSFVNFLSSGGNGAIVLRNMTASGLWFYFYNEIATTIIAKTNPVTQSVLNTAKRAFIMIAAAIVLREGLSTAKLVGSLISIAGVFLYSNIDRIVGK